jgi:hypothetical protein
MKFTKKDQARRSEIIKQLSELSRDGWWRACRYDYVPLERELRELTEKMTRQ